MNVETKEVVAVEVTTDDVHDSKVFSRLLKKAEPRGRSPRFMVTEHSTAQGFTSCLGLRG